MLPSSALPFPGVMIQARMEVGSNIPPEVMTVFSSANPGTEDGEEPPAPRTYFPETWVWDLVPVG